MPNPRISVRRLKELLRLKAAGLSFRQMSAATGLSLGAVSKYLKAADAAGLAWPLPAGLDDTTLERQLAGAPPTLPSRRTPPDYALVHQELKRKGVTLQLLWEEYRDAHAGEAYGYTQFTVHYREWAATLKRSMRQLHRAGEKLFVDFAGQTVPITDPHSGEIRPAQIFVAVLGASNYAYAEAVASQKLADWIGAHVRTFHHLGGVTDIVVPDNPKAGVNRACRYEPELNRSYQEMAAHYGVVVIPARPHHPKDKAKVEVGVQVVERWLLARLRKRRFFSLAELNAAIAELLPSLNERPFKKLPGCRRTAFEQIDRPALKALPAAPYEFAEWKTARVSIDYHVEVDGHYYSVPHALVKKQVDVRASATTIECFVGGRRVASHVRSPKRGAHSTDAAHMPASHRAHAQWSPGRLLNWGLSIGPSTRDVVRHLLEAKPHPEQGYRACLGILALEKRFGRDRLEAACRRALTTGAPSYRSVRSILINGLDQAPDLYSEIADHPLPAHDNVRGPSYYH